MEVRRHSNRREFLRLSFAGVVGTAVLAACAPATPPTATPAPKPTEAPKPAAAAPTATTAPAAAPTPAPKPTEAPKPTVAPTPAPAKAAKVEVDFWNPATDKLGSRIIADLVDGFNKKNDKIVVKDTVVPDENHYAKYVTAISAGQSMGGIMTYEYTPIVNWAAEGFIVNLDDYQKTMGIKKEDYFPVIWQMISFHGHLWGFVQEFDFDILTYNKTLFEKAGLSPDAPPKTMDEMDKLAAQLTTKDSSGNLKQVGFCPWMRGNILLWSAAWGGQYYDPAADKWTVVSDGNVKALEWYAGYAKVLGGPDKVSSFTKQFTGDQTPFYSEQLAMYMMGEYTPITLPERAPKLKYGLAFPPTGPGVPYGTGQTDGGNVFLLPKGAPHPGESMEFLTYMGGPEAVLKWNVEENNVPPVKAVAFDENFIKDTPLMKLWIDMLKQDHMTPPATSPVAAEFSDELNTAMEEVTYGKKTAKNALTDLAKKVDAKLQEFKASHPNW